MLPREIPERLRSLGIPLENQDVDDLAWNKADALDVIDSLKGTKVAILGGDVYRSEPWGFVPAYDNWTCIRMEGELASEYARRTRQVAATFVQEYDDDQASNVFFALRFSTQQEAA